MELGKELGSKDEIFTSTFVDPVVALLKKITSLSIWIQMAL